jgi:hypothetical protein
MKRRGLRGGLKPATSSGVKADAGSSPVECYTTGDDAISFFVPEGRDESVTRPVTGLQSRAFPALVTRLKLLFGARTPLYFPAPHLKKLRVGGADITCDLIAAPPIPAIGPAPVGGPAARGDDRLLAAALPPGPPVLLKCAYVA